MMSGAPSAGKRPLSDIAKEAEANGRARKRRARPRRGSLPPPPAPPLPSAYRLGETVYRILCPASKTGSIIGKGGGIIQSIREDTGASIRIEDAVFGCDERVVTVSAKEEGFTPQKFRVPGNYPKGKDGDKPDYLSEMDEEEARAEAHVESAAEKETQQAEGISEKETQPTGENVAPPMENISQKETEGTEEKVTQPVDEQEKSQPENGADKEMALEGEVMPEKKEEGNKDVKEETGQMAHESEVETQESGLAPVQEALLRVYLRIIEPDPLKPEDNKVVEGKQEICTRLLVPTTQVGCLLGKKGKIVSQMRQQTGAQIRVLPRDRLPLCASEMDEVVQIIGDLMSARKALIAVSTQLRNNPPKKMGEESGPSLKQPRPVEEKSPSVSRSKSVSRRPPSPGPSLGHSSAFSGRLEVTFRILCPKEKIGGIIGRGGSIVQSIREETGAKISIDVSSDVGEERVIRVSAVEYPEDTYSKAQRAVIILHSKILAADDKDGKVITKLLVPADQAGCILGKGGSIIGEIRKITRSKIHIHGKDRLPPCASRSDELVEVVGDFTASREALIQITGRLRNNLFDQEMGVGHYDEKLPFQGRAPSDERPWSLRTEGIPAPAPYDSYRSAYSDDRYRSAYSEDRYRSAYSDDHLGLNGPQSYGLLPTQPSYGQEIRGKAFPEYLGLGHSWDLVKETPRPNPAYVTSQTVEVVVPEHSISSIVGDSGSNLQQICKISGARVKVNGSTKPGALERIVEITGTPDQTHAAQSLLQAFILSGQ